jgi:hypothetical protein
VGYGNVEHTYSWGNTANQHGWNLDQPEDIAAAEDALRNPGSLDRRGGADLDSYVDMAFNEVNKPENEHRWWPWNNCKHGANGLLNEAQTRHDRDRKGCKK